MASLLQIRAHVASILRKAPESRVVGIRTVNGWKDTDKIRVNDRDYKVIHCASELQIREALLDASSAAPIVIVTNLEEADLGQDLVARFARRRLHPIDGWTILKDVFQAREIDPTLLRRAWLADFVMEVLPPEGVPPVPSGVLDAETVWGLILRKSLGFESSRIDAQDLLRWSLDGSNVERFTRLSPETRNAVRAWISEYAGKSAEAIFDCIDAGFGTDAFPIGLALSVVFTNQTDVTLQAAAARLERYIGGRPLPREVGDAWSEAAQRLFERLDAMKGDQHLLALVERSDQILKDVRADTSAWLSEFSRLGFEHRLDQFGRALSAGLRLGPGQVSREIRQTADSVRSHRWAKRFHARVNQVEMAMRVLQWLAGGGGIAGEELQSFQEAANAYAREGGFVDWARQSLFYGDPVAGLSTAYDHLSQLVTQRREEQNCRFATLLTSWMEAGCREESVVLIENVLKAAVAPAAQVAPLLLIVIDGMSFAVYRELVEDILRNGWVELAPKTKAPEPVIAALPSVTEVCRRTLLSGKLMSGTGEDEKTGFSSQVELLQVSKSGTPPVLFQKSDLTDLGGASLAEELRSEIASPKRRVVAAIVNAVDDHLLKGDQVAVPWKLRYIPVLYNLLAAAMESGRVVILTSDHGHVLDRQTSYRPSTGGERFRNLEGGPEPGEILVSGSRVVQPEGQLIAPWSEKIRYGGKRNGYHGGVSPQECVIPLAMLGRHSQIPEGYEARPAYEPDWWHVGVADQTSAAPRVVTAATTEHRPSTKGQAQLPFQDVSRPVTWIDRLVETTVFARQVALAGRSAPATERIRQFLFALDERGGTILRQALAQKLGEPEFRIPGLVAAVRRILNLDGYPVLSVDDASDSVVLNRQLLEVQFEILLHEGESRA